MFKKVFSPLTLYLLLCSRYNKRINDIRECKEQALSHAYVHNLVTPSHTSIFIQFVPNAHRNWVFPMYFPVLIFSIIHLYPAHRLWSSPQGVSHRMITFFFPLSPIQFLPRFVLPLCLISALILLLILSSPFISTLILLPSLPSTYFCASAGLSSKCQNTIYP